YEAPSKIFPGLTLLFPASAGGYDTRTGLDPKGEKPVQPVDVSRPAKIKEERDYDGDELSEWKKWYTLRQHSDDVAREAEAIVQLLRLPNQLLSAVTTA